MKILELADLQLLYPIVPLIKPDMHLELKLNVWQLITNLNQIQNRIFLQSIKYWLQ